MIRPSEGYTILKINERFYPMLVRMSAEGDPEVTPLRDLSSQRVISYMKRSSAVTYTYTDKELRSEKERSPSPSDTSA